MLEAKVSLSWINPDPEYSDALRGFIDRILAAPPRGRHNQFLDALEKFASLVAFFGAMNSVAQAVLKITSPGVPDIYQGTELWDFSLVDPDNRRAVDFELRNRMLSELEAADASTSLPELCQELIRNFQDGRIKLWTTSRALRFRREHASLFQSGKYIPLFASGEKQEHVCAFARVQGNDAALIAVPRRDSKLTGGAQCPPTGEIWGNTELPVPQGTTRLRDVFTGNQLEPSSRGAVLCRELLAHFPVALLACR